MPKRSIDNRLDFLSPVSLVPGIGGRRASALKEAGIATLGDLLYHFPRRYVDRSRIVPLGDLARYEGQECTVVGSVTRTRVEKGRRPRFRILIENDHASMEVLFFHGIPYLRNSIHTGQRYCFTGKIGRFTGYQMVHPMMERVGSDKEGPEYPFLPVYPLTGALRDANMQQKGLQKAIQWVIENLKHYPQIIPESICERRNFFPLQQCLQQIHFPGNPSELEPFRARIRYEELYQVALTLRWSRRGWQQPGRQKHPGTMVDTVRNMLPFTLTKEQDKALDLLLRDAAAPVRMHRLLQGDVGAGKTIVALLSCLPALNEGFQVAWLAPTEILARQSFSTIEPILRSIGVAPVLLTAGIAAQDKREIRAGLKKGTVPFVIGTHALVQPSVEFRRLGMIVIDEQQRFGAEQRLAMQKKDATADFLLMSATPIPQSLAKTLYGDLEVATIEARPQGREPISTHLVPDVKRQDMIRFIREKALEKGEQAFWVVPRIDQVDDDEKIRDVAGVVEELERGLLHDVPIGAIHGRMTTEETADIMTRFSKGELRVLVATTIVEVGIDVAAATIMVIENAERFGLAQLHQLRGRVGRAPGSRGFCFLLANETNDGEAQQRLRQFCSLHDGFALAELDLKLRGPGEVAGHRQSGWEDFRMADILRDADLFREIQDDIAALLGS